MKYSYSDSLITLAASVRQAYSLHLNKMNNPVAATSIKGSTVKFDSITYPHKCCVGIKFDNISARKYSFLIHSTQRFAVIK